jgi:hypothetical protein
VIEVSYMRAKRTRYLWVSRRDHRPRKVKEIIRLADNQVTVMVEEWSQVSLNLEIPQRMLT